MPARIFIKLCTPPVMFTCGAHPDLLFIGTIQRGQEIGALARNAAGAYFQVNGDIVRSVHAKKIAPALADAQRFQELRRALAPPTVVVRKKRRNIALSDLASA